MIHNPAARNMRRDGPVIAAALKTVFPRFTGMASPGRGHTARLVRDALREGHTEIVAVGGDGTLNEAVNGFFEQGGPVNPEAVLNMVCTGTGDLAGRETGVAAALALAGQDARPRDLGHVACVTTEGRAAARFFLGSASFGLTGDVARRANRARILPMLSQRLARDASELAALAAWRGAHVRLIADHGQDEIDGISSVAVLNGARFGGGLKAAPEADPSDGQFDIAILGGAGRSSLRRAMAGLRAGQDAGLRLWRSTRLTAAPTLETSSPVVVETDGEAVGQLPATFVMLPRAIRVRGGA